MKEYVIISDGSCDLSEESKKELDVEVVPFYVSFGDEVYYKEGKDIAVRDFYQKLVDEPNVFPKSSLPSVNDYYEVFKKYAEMNKNIICLCITRKFSGSYNSAMTAKDLILEEYPEIKITIIDTIVNTVLQGLVVKEAAKARLNGMDYDMLVSKIEEIKSSGRIFFTIKGLSYLQHGGRIGKLSSIVGNLLRISPLITLKEGEIFSSGISLSRVRSMLKVEDMLHNYLKEVNGTSDDYVVVCGYGYDIEEAKQFREKIAKSLPGYDIKLEQIGATIACHTGPYPIGVGVVKKIK